MSTESRTPPIGPVRLTKADHARFVEFVRRDGRSQSDVLRDAIVQYMDGYNSAEDDRRLKERDRVIADALKGMENRFAVLLVRLGIDLESIYALAWSLTSEQPDQREMFEKCYQVGVNRFRRKLKGLEKEMVDSLIHQGDQLKPKKKSVAVEDDEAEAEDDD